MDNPKPPYVCDFEDCERLLVPGTKRCREHPKPAVKHEGTQPTSGIVFHKHGAPEGLAERLEWVARRMEILGAEIAAELRDIGKVAHWEQQQNRDDEE